MTDEQFEILSEYENIFYTATQRRYVMFGTLENKKRLSGLYAEIFNKKSNMMNGCGRCALRETQEIAKVYYEEKELREIKQKQSTEVVENKPKRKKKKTDD